MGVGRTFFRMSFALKICSEGITAGFADFFADDFLVVFAM
jgi:hypothetical protein